MITLTRNGFSKQSFSLLFASFAVQEHCRLVTFTFHAKLKRLTCCFKQFTWIPFFLLLVTCCFSCNLDLMPKYNAMKTPLLKVMKSMSNVSHAKNACAWANYASCMEESIWWCQCNAFRSKFEFETGVLVCVWGVISVFLFNFEMNTNMIEFNEPNLCLIKPVWM